MCVGATVKVTLPPKHAFMSASPYAKAMMARKKVAASSIVVYQIHLMDLEKDPKKAEQGALAEGEAPLYEYEYDENGKMKMSDWQKPKFNNNMFWIINGIIVLGGTHAIY